MKAMYCKKDRRVFLTKAQNMPVLLVSTQSALHIHVYCMALALYDQMVMTSCTLHKLVIVCFVFVDFGLFFYEKSKLSNKAWQIFIAQIGG
jgi:hypothetical protein